MKSYFWMLSLAIFFLACAENQENPQAEPKDSIASVEDSLPMSEDEMALIADSLREVQEAYQSTIPDRPPLDFRQMERHNGEQWLALTWRHLARIDFEERYYEEVAELFLFPKFSPEIKEIEGKKVTISGFYIPLAPEEDFYALSKSSFNSCFFCGAAGPETVMEIRFKEKPEGLSMDDFIRVGGTLRLNDQDIDHMNYILEDPELLEN